LAGQTQEAIAERLGVSQATVSRDLQTLHQQWIEDAAIDFSTAKARELARIDRLEREYWAGYLRSMQPLETQTKRAVETVKAAKDTAQTGVMEVPGGGRKEAIIRTVDQVGDPRWLKGIEWCIERRCKILGVDAPQRIDPITHRVMLLFGDGGELDDTYRLDQ
jgi:transcriptional regulator with XRE-family HTH domain